MNPEVRRIADAILYEGYLLYPYRPSSVKNRQRWTFGGLFPPAYHSDPSSLHSELLVAAEARASARITVRFLHLLSRQTERGAWQEAVEREVSVFGPGGQQFTFPAWRDGGHRQEQVDGVVASSIEEVSEGLYRVAINVANRTQFRGSTKTTRDEASLQALIATHIVAEISDGAFVSLMDPPEQYRDAAARCSNLGVWPVLAGDEGSRGCMLISPIILYDYPRVAPQSPGDLFDGAEIDEILTLRIMTMTDEEKAEMRNTDERARRILERTESLAPEDLMKLHGVLRNPRAAGSGQ